MFAVRRSSAGLSEAWRCTERQNKEMIDKFVHKGIIRSTEVEGAFRAVPRGAFVPHELQGKAYIDSPLRGEPHVHLSAPHMYATVLEALQLSSGLSFLNIGSGTGYFSCLAGYILQTQGINHGIELHEDLVQFAKERVEKYLQFCQAIAHDICIPQFVAGNCFGTDPPGGSYDRVYCGAACPLSKLTFILEFTKIGGFAIVPCENKLLKIERVSATELQETCICNVSFAPLVAMPESESSLPKESPKTKEKKTPGQGTTTDVTQKRDPSGHEKVQDLRQESVQLQSRGREDLPGSSRQQRGDENLQRQLSETRQREENAQRQLTEMQQREEDSRKQLSEMQQREENSQIQLRELRQQEEHLQSQLTDMQRQGENLQTQLTETQQREEDLRRQVSEMQQREENSQRQMKEVQQREENSEKQLREITQREENLQRQLANYENQVSELQLSFSAAQLTISGLRNQGTRDWVISRDEIQMKEHCLGRGGWGSVFEGVYCGCTVAVKQIHELILSPHNIRLFEREMNIASKCRHPHLLQFIGATIDEGNPLFVTELMEKSLRALLEQRQLSETEVAVISLDVACALNYLHQKKPEPIIHRDVSSANVLLWRQGDQWRAKVSDYGTANVMQHTMTVAPGAMIYSAPEALTPNQTVKVDVYSFGVLLCEMCIRELPDPRRRDEQVLLVTNGVLRGLVRRCLQRDPGTRPTTQGIIDELKDFNTTS